MFRTKGKDGVNGIVGIPDAVLVSFDKNDKKSCIKINIIEYECYGKEKSTSTKKFDYLNSHIIPQLIKFASTFSIVTDSQELIMFLIVSRCSPVNSSIINIIRILFLNAFRNSFLNLSKICDSLV